MIQIQKRKKVLLTKRRHQKSEGFVNYSNNRKHPSLMFDRQSYHTGDVQCLLRSCQRVGREYWGGRVGGGNTLEQKNSYCFHRTLKLISLRVHRHLLCLWCSCMFGTRAAEHRDNRTHSYLWWWDQHHSDLFWQLGVWIVAAHTHTRTHMSITAFLAVLYI